jgi:hypothetical protein
VSPSFFSLLGIRLLDGRTFSDRDIKGSPKVAIVSASLAKSLFGVRSAIHETLYWGDSFQIVGVVDDVRWKRPQEEAMPAFYLPIAQQTSLVTSVVARTSLSQQAFIAAAREVVRSIDPNQPLDRVILLKDVADQATADQRFYAFVSFTFALLALVLGALSVFAAVEAAVGERLREIGVRIALGATPRRIWRLTMSLGLGPVGIGLGLGVAASLAGLRTLRNFLFDIGPIDPIALMTTAAVLVAVALLACFLPARRAMRTDPLTILRRD